ncbi:MAG: hypothetical protein KDA21_00670 [Phycisphaerales bacterium]|nr:hypothetical protein [Phycisphaerales bacterium]
MITRPGPVRTHVRVAAAITLTLALLTAIAVASFCRRLGIGWDFTLAFSAAAPLVVLLVGFVLTVMFTPGRDLLFHDASDETCLLMRIHHRGRTREVRNGSGVLLARIESEWTSLRRIWTLTAPHYVTFITTETPASIVLIQAITARLAGRLLPWIFDTDVWLHAPDHSVACRFIRRVGWGEPRILEFDPNPWGVNELAWIAFATLLVRDRDDR